MRRFLLLLLLASAILGLPLLAVMADEPPPIDGKALLTHVKWLAHDDREGRASGSPGAQASAEYIAGHFRELGLEPAGDDGTFFQTWPLPRGFEIGPETVLVATRDTKALTFKLEKDIMPLSVSGPGDVSAPAVFAGYGISAPELGYDDYAGVDVKGKVVVVLRHAPGLEDRKCAFSNPAAQRRYATFPAKAQTAAAAGAAALVIVNDPAQCWKPKDDELVRDVGGNPGSLPVFHMTYRAGRRLGKLCGIGLQREQRAIDKDLAPRSRPLEGILLRVNAALEAKKLTVRNVCARLRAPGEGPRETLVVGGHFDHLGRGEYGSLAGSKGEGEIHNGADDNASGTAAVMEIATFLMRRRARLVRDVVFVLFTAEELGLLGSKHYVESPSAPLAQTVAMVNLDMVSRLGRGRLQVGGTGTSPVFEPLIEEKNKEHRLTLRLNPGGRAPSDNAPFYEKSIPVLFFFTGLHGDYHRPDDDVKELDRRGFEKVVRLAADVCEDLASRADRPAFARSDASGLAAGPHLGLTVEQRPEGVFVLHAEERSPAARVRFEVGDKIEEFAGEPIRTTSEFNAAHSRAKPRARVTITVRRGTRLLDLEPKLGKD